MKLSDAIVLIIILSLISFYGLYKSRRRQTTLNELLHGSGMSILTTSLSVCSSCLSAISILGFTAEIYYHGAMLYWYGVMYVISFPIVAFLFLPISYKLKYTSIHEYLERRFCFPCRLFASVLFSIQMLLYVSVVLYAPSLALSSVTPLPLWVSILVTAGLSGIYVSLGGAKASVYTSSLQMALILISMTVILLYSITTTSITDIYMVANRGGRLQIFDFRVDPRIRHSVWSLLIGGTGTILSSFAVNQLTVQRYLAMNTLREAQMVVLLNIVFNFLILSLYVGTGLLVYHFYYNCDPNMIFKDRLLPHFVTERMSEFPGLVGLFIASIYSASMSTLSASYSALSAVFIEDFVKQYYRKLRNGEEIDIRLSIKLAKIFPAVICVLTIGLSYLCSHFQTMLLQIALSIFGVAGGPILGVFCLGYFFPYVRKEAAFIGLICSTALCAFITIGAIVENVKPIGLPLDGSCGSNSSSATFDADNPAYGMVEPLNSDSWLTQLFRISYQYYSAIAVIASFIVAFFAQVLVDYCSTKRADDYVDGELLAPCVNRIYSPLQVESYVVKYATDECTIGSARY